MWYTKTYEESGRWFRDIAELIEEIEQDGGEVAYADGEMVDFFTDFGTEYVVRIGGTGTTKIIESVEKIEDED